MVATFGGTWIGPGKTLTLTKAGLGREVIMIDACQSSAHLPAAPKVLSCCLRTRGALDSVGLQLAGEATVKSDVLCADQEDVNVVTGIAFLDQRNLEAAVASE